ncbi:hypothetical protein [Clostridium tertium]|uniref:hypothetical protein n=1 Tax=Clostridium tertium TaxID=1559 RepID=UPI0035659705
MKDRYNLKFYTGTVKENPSEEMKGLEEINLVILELRENDEEVMICYPTTLKDCEKYYKLAFESIGKEWISEDYKEFLEYILDPDCEIISSTKRSNFKNIVELTKDDDEKSYKALYEFKVKYINE